MKNCEKNLKGNRVTGAFLEVKYPGIENHFDKTAERFMESAAYAPAGTEMELRIDLPAEGKVSCLVSGNAGAEKEDYQWIFGTYVLLKEAGPELLGEGTGEKAFSYVFRQAGKEDYYYEEESYNLFTALVRCGAAITLRAEKTEGGEVVARAGMEMECPAPLMVRTLLGSHFVRMETVDAAWAEEGEERGRIPLSCALRFIRMILDLAEETAQEESRKEKELPEPELSEGWSGNIEDMELPVRAYNCLKRAGYHTYEDLLGLTEEDLYRIRNMGRKTADIILEKIEEYRGCPIRKKETGEKKDYNAMLEELIGLSAVKDHVRRIRALARMKKDMQDKGMDTLPFSLHMGFLGNPGTAKTTAARILGGILYEAGILKSDQIMEVGRADLIGRYAGETAQKVQKVFSWADGKLLFIDEAYSLLDHWDGSYGDEAINTIVQEMENRRDSTVVVFAGYPGEMETFFQRNPGLKSRVPFMISFENYKAEELLSISRLEAEKRGFTLAPEAEDKIREICQAFMKDKDFGNGRFCRNLVEDAVLSYAERIYGEGSGDGSGTDLVLSGRDFRYPERKNCSRERRIGFA